MNVFYSTVLFASGASGTNKVESSQTIAVSNFSRANFMHTTTEEVVGITLCIVVVVLWDWRAFRFLNDSAADN